MLEILESDSILYVSLTSPAQWFDIIIFHNHFLHHIPLGQI